jgi:hypothetical protein
VQKPSRNLAEASKRFSETHPPGGWTYFPQVAGRISA